MDFNRCDYCGRFISYDEFDNFDAVVKLVYPDSEFTKEEFEVYHVKCQENHARAN